MFYLFENFALDTDRHELRRGEDLVALEPQVFDLLEYVVRNRDRLVTKDDLVASVWGGRIVSESTLSTRIHAARQAIGDSGEAQRLLRTIQRKGIRFVGEVREGANPADSAAAAPASPSPSMAKRPSIAVLPFDNMSSEPDQEYFADGITEDIITALSKWRWLLVFARNSTFAFRGTGTPVKQIAAELGARYVLEGSIRQAGGRIRVTAQLIEAATDRHVWAERFDRDLSDVFTVQDEITQRVVSAIDPAIGISEIDRAARERSSDVHAWDHFLKGNYYYHRYNKRDMQTARAELQQAIDIDPHFAAAHARLAAAHAMEIAVGWAENLPESIAAIQRSANTAIALDDLDASAHVALAYARLHAREFEPAIAAARRAVELNPNYHDACFALGLTLLAGGYAVPAVAAFGNALRLNPRDPAGWNQLGLAMSYYTDKQYEAAMQAVDRALANRPRFGGAKIIKSAILVRLGKTDEARVLLAEVPAAGFSQLVMFQLYKAKEDLEHYLAALETAGWKRKRSSDD